MDLYLLSLAMSISDPDFYRDEEDKKEIEQSFYSEHTTSSFFPRTLIFGRVGVERGLDLSAMTGRVVDLLIRLGEVSMAEEA